MFGSATVISYVTDWWGGLRQDDQNFCVGLLLLFIGLLAGTIMIGCLVNWGMAFTVLGGVIVFCCLIGGLSLLAAA